MKAAQLYKPDPDFRAIARTHQSNYREQTLQVDFDEQDPQAKYGNLLPYWAAKKGYNFYEGYRDKIINTLEERYGKQYSKPLYANLLRSEHIPLNIFTPMGYNLNAAKVVICDILGRDISAVIDVKIEYAPSPAQNYLGDRTSFDAYIEYLDADNRKCGVGIEVKYTEQEYKIKKESKEYRDVIEKQNLRYSTHTNNSGYYIGDPYDLLSKDEFRQIWRNHILGASMVETGEIEDFTCIHLFPKGNKHFIDVIPKYKELMSDKGDRSFIDLTFEKLFGLLGKHYIGDEEQKWVEYLKSRYIF